jgi:hypothetical protein
VARVDLETLALRAVEVTVLGREDPRLLVATKRKLTKPHKVARLIAGLANSAYGRRSILLIGLRSDKVHGLDAIPDADWWDELDDSFPGRVPRLDWMIIDIDGAQVLAIAPEQLDELLVAHDGDDIIVPWFDRGGIRTSRPRRAERSSESLPTATIRGGWVAKSTLDLDGPIDSFCGQIDVELDAVTGMVADSSCSATLLMPTRDRSIELDVQVHPSSDDVGLFRHDAGIEVRSTFTVRLYLAAAVRGKVSDKDPASIQLVISLLLPGRTVPELRSLLLSPDPSRRSRWLV